MENRLILTSKTSVAYSMTLVVFMFFAVIGIVIFSHIESKWSPYFQGFIAIGYLLCVLDYIFSNRRVYFYIDHMIIKYTFTRKVKRIDYNEFVNFLYEPNLKPSRLIRRTISENGLIKIEIKDKPPFRLSEMQFENFSIMRVLLQEVIRDEFNPDEWY